MTALGSLWLAGPIILALLPACQAGSGGPLVPVAAPGVERVADERWGQAAIVRNGTLTARIVGRWNGERAQTLRITYRNGGPAPVRITMAGLKLMHGPDVAGLWTAVDATGVDLADARPDNNEGPLLYALNDPATHDRGLVVPAGASREVDAELTSFGRPIAAGSEVVAVVPVASGSVRVTFTTGRAGLLPS